MKRPRLAGAACGLVLCVVAAGCGAGGAATAPEQQNSTPAASGHLKKITWLLSLEPGSLDQDNDKTTSSDTILANVCDRLMAQNPDLTIKPGVVSKYTRPDPTTLVFDLRTDVRFHDGSKMTAADVTWSMKRHSTKDASESDEYSNVSSITTTGPDQVTVRFKQPDAIFLSAMVGDGGIIWNPRVIRKLGKDFGTPGTPDACSGPYELSDWVPGDHLTISAAPDYWGRTKPLTKDVSFRWADDSAIASLIAGGEAQGSYLSSPDIAASFRGNKDVTVTQGASTDVWSFMLTDRGPMRSHRLREALAMVMPRHGINEAGFAGLGKPWKAPVGPGSWGYRTDEFRKAYARLGGSPAEPTAADVARAKALVRESGQSGRTLVVATDSQPIRTVMANGFVSAAKSIGLDARIISVPPQKYGDFYTDAKLRRTADAWIDNYYISKADPMGFYKSGSSDSENNFLKISDPTYDSLVKKAEGTVDDAARARLAIKVQQMWNDRMPWISAVQASSTMVMSTEITGATASAAYLYSPWAAAIGKAGK